MSILILKLFIDTKTMFNSKTRSEICKFYNEKWTTKKKN